MKLFDTSTRDMNDINTFTKTREQVHSLIGDFYKNSVNRDRKQMNETLSKLNAILENENNESAGSPIDSDFLKYFNDIYSGRTAYNPIINIIDYPVESVIRELLQNAFDCNYDNPDIRVAVNFKEIGDEYVISLSYNETGFTLEQFLYFLSFGRNNGDLSREGRFGFGAKSVFINTEWLSMRSNGFRFKVINNHGLLTIEKIKLSSPIFKGTEISIGVDSVQFEKIKNDFLLITERKGSYINLIELCFAFNRKKIINNQTIDKESIQHTFHIAVLENNNLNVVYTMQNHFNETAGIEVIRFRQNKKSVIDFICCENEGYTFLVPFAVSQNKREQLVRLLTDRYNYFSTFELFNTYNTSLPDTLYKRFPAFFISVPNRFITSSRSGIRHDSIIEIEKNIKAGLFKLIDDYKRFFILELLPCPDNDGSYVLRPDSYIFEFIRSYIQNINTNENVKEKFQNSICVLFPNENKPVPYKTLILNAYSCCTKNAGEAITDSIGTYRKFIREKLDLMENRLKNIPNKTLYAAYEWVDDDLTKEKTFIPENINKNSTSNEVKRVYTYEFYRNDKKYVIDSRISQVFTDYSLYNRFINFNFT